MDFLDSNDFARITREHVQYEEKREEFIRKSRDVIRASKQVIHASQQGEAKAASSAFKTLDAEKKRLDALKKSGGDLTRVGIGFVALQEYVEARAFKEFAAGKKISSAKSMSVPWEPYLTGLCDLSGELVRLTVNDAIKGELATARRVKDFLDELYGRLTALDAHGGELRKKTDMLRWNLSKVEDIILNHGGK